MRIIGGRFKGRRIISPKGTRTRPTTDQVREAAFNLLNARLSLEGIEVLDLFCGSGALGLEAISRGAASATFVDMSRDALRTVADNASALGVADQCSFLMRDGLRYLASPATPEYDLILADPPYRFPSVGDLPVRAIEKLRAGGLLLLEHDAHIRFDPSAVTVESRSYGRTIVSIFRASQTPIGGRSP